MNAISIETYAEQIRRELPFCLKETTIAAGKKYTGKVRDVYDLDDKLIMITTDRLSAFDRMLAVVPYKGQVLNLTAAWWFEKTQQHFRACLRQYSRA